MKSLHKYIAAKSKGKRYPIGDSEKKRKARYRKMLKEAEKFVTF